MKNQLLLLQDEITNKVKYNYKVESIIMWEHTTCITQESHTTPASNNV